MGTVGSVIADIENPGTPVLLWNCPRMLIWISPEMTGTAINHAASASKNVYQVTEMTKDQKQAMETHGISCKSKDIYYYKDFRYERLADAVRYAEIDTERRQLKGEFS